MQRLALIFLFMGLLTTTAFAQMQVTVSILPQKYFVERIAGDRVTVTVMVQPGANPATYEPKPSQMVELAQSEVFFAVGAPFEANWMKRFQSANKRMLIVHTDDRIEKLAMKSHGHEGEVPAEDTATRDPHVWLSPRLVKIQARHILSGLVAVDPDGRELFMQNYQAFMQEIDTLDAEITRTLRPVRDRTFMVFHPTWGYFAHDYRLNQIPVEVEGKAPKPSQLKALIEEVKEEGIRAIFVQPQFSQKSAETIANATGISVVVVDPLSEEWADNMLSVAQTFLHHLSAQQ